MTSWLQSLGKGVSKSQIAMKDGEQQQGLTMIGWECEYEDDEICA